MVETNFMNKEETKTYSYKGKQRICHQQACAEKMTKIVFSEQKENNEKEKILSK